MLRAVVYAGTAQDALGVFHPSDLNHGIDIQAHRAVAGACLTIGAGSRVSYQSQRGPAEAVADPAPDDHEGRHPADGVAAGPPPDKDCQPDEQANDEVIDDVAGTSVSCNRDASSG